MIQTGIVLVSGRYMKCRGDPELAKAVRFATRRPAMMPMVFCASFVPWDSEKNAADPSWARRNQRSTEAYGARRNVQDTATMRPNPNTIPINGESTMNDSVFTHAAPGTIAWIPTRATAAPE